MLNWHPFDQVPTWVLCLGIILALLLLPVTLAGALFGRDWSLMGLSNIAASRRRRKQGPAPSR